MGEGPSRGSRARVSITGAGRFRRRRCTGAVELESVMDVLTLIDRLDDTVDNAKAGLIGSQVKVDKEETYAILDDMRATIPEQIKQARWIAKERQEMLEEAKREGERALEEARKERDRLVGEEEIAKLAERRAEHILEQARKREREIRLRAEDYADDILMSLETNLDRFKAAVERGRERLAGPQEAAVR